MRIKIKDGYIYIIEANIKQATIFKSWMQLKWDKKMQWWAGPISLELLNKLSKIIPLPDTIKAEHRRLKAVQDAVDKERVRPDKEVKPLVHYPVKKILYAHQVRAANMCLLTFGLVEPVEQ